MYINVLTFYHFVILTEWVYILGATKEYNGEKYMVYDVANWKKLSKNEQNLRRYLKKYHPDKYEELVWRETLEQLA